jgi:hypothetical protein
LDDGPDGFSGGVAMNGFFHPLCRRGRLIPIASAVSILVLAACGSENMEYSYPDSGGDERSGTVYAEDKDTSSIFGPGGITLFGGGDRDRGQGGGPSGIAVNSFLWRASLDTISFMPLISADPFGGVIITDWHSPPETPDERFKMNVYILGRQLRADGLRVAVFRQKRGADGWVTAEVNAETSTQLENKILDRARQLRIATVSVN